MLHDAGESREGKSVDEVEEEDVVEDVCGGERLDEISMPELDNDGAVQR